MCDSDATYTGYDTLTYAGENSLLTGTADELLDIGPDSNPGLGYHLDTVLGDSRHGRSVDDLGVDRHLHGLEHIAAGEVDGSRHLEVEVDIGLVCGNQGIDHIGHVALRQVVSLKRIGVQLQAGLGTSDHSHDDGARRNLPPPHQHQLDEGDTHSRDQSLEPQGHREEPEQDNQGHDGHSYPDNNESY